MAPTHPSPLEAVLEELSAYDFSHPRDPDKPLVDPYDPSPERHCDLVMKGGITSGVVYPLAVLHLAKSHRFHAIGGTSAGAIAAVVTAAAEYGRDSGGFQRLIATVREFQQPGFVANVFQPAPELRPVLGLLFLILKIKRRTKLQEEAKLAGAAPASELPPPTMPSRGEIAGDVLKLLLNLTFAGITLPAMLGGALGGILGALIGGGWIAAARTASDAQAALRLLIWGVLVIGLFWWLGHVLGTIGSLLLRELPHNAFGLCSGRGVHAHYDHRFVETANREPPALTDWLAKTIDTIAGVEHGPLTLRDLEYNRAEQVDPKRKITLNTVTTNISQGQPYILPFSGRQYLFSKQEWLTLFPTDVVQHMIDCAYVPDNLDLSRPILDEHGNEHQLYFLPADPKQLPVVVAARMSLSFPILLSAVPLWTISKTMFDTEEYRNAGARYPLTARDVRRNWFSDGGICSNFPIHFYDRLFPVHPTFGINLSDEPSIPFPGAVLQPDPQWEVPAELGQTGNGAVQPSSLRRPCATDPSVVLPSSYPEDQPGPLWTQVDHDLPSFIGAIINSGVFYRDILQSRLPSYYDRTITVRLKDSEGGLNLDMPAATVGKIAIKGLHAGEALTSCFDFDHHRWVRLRLLLSQLEQQMIELRGPMMLDQPLLKPELLRQELDRIRDFLQRNNSTTNNVQQLMIAQQNSFGNEQQRFPFPGDAVWTEASLPRLYALLMLIEVWGGNKTALFQLDGPSIPSDAVNDDVDRVRLRVTPEL